MLIPAWAILPSPYDALPDLPDKFAFIVFWIVSVVADHLHDSQIQPVSRRDFDGRIAYLVMAYIYIFAMPAAEAYRGEKPFGYAVLNKIGGATDHLVLFKTQGPLFYLNPPNPLPEFDKKQDLQDAIAKGDAKWMIVRRRDMPKLDTPTTVELSEASYPWENDYNYPKQGSAGADWQLIRKHRDASEWRGPPCPRLNPRPSAQRHRGFSRGHGGPRHLSGWLRDQGRARPNGRQRLIGSEAPPRRPLRPERRHRDYRDPGCR